MALLKHTTWTHVYCNAPEMAKTAYSERTITQATRDLKKKKSKTIHRWVSTIRSVKWCWRRTLSCQQHFPPPHTLSGMLKSPPHCIHPHSHHQYHLISTRANTMTNSSTAFTKVSGPCTSHVLCMVVVNNDIWFHFNFQMRYCTLVNHQTQ